MHILDRLVSEGKLQSVERDYLLRELSAAESELSMGDLKIRQLEDERLKEALDEADKRINEMSKPLETLNQEAAREAAKQRGIVNIMIFGTLSVAAVVCIVAWNGFAAWVNSQPNSSRFGEEKEIPGLGITSSEYERRSNCLLNDGC
jgi:hypothetical protein